MEMTRRIREQHYQQLSDKSSKERIAFYQEQARQMEAIVAVLLKEKEAASIIVKPKATDENDWCG